MHKYIVRLTDQERDELTAVIKKLKGTSERVRRAQILLKARRTGCLGGGFGQADGGNKKEEVH